MQTKELVFQDETAQQEFGFKRYHMIFLKKGKRANQPELENFLSGTEKT